MLCLVPLHPGRWSMTRFRAAYASVTAYVPSWYRCDCRRVSYFLPLWVDISVLRTLHRNQVLRQYVVLVPGITQWMWVLVSIYSWHWLQGAGSVTTYRSRVTTGPPNVGATVNRITPKTLACTNIDCSGHRALLFFSSAAGVRTYCYVLDLLKSVLFRYLYAILIRCADDYDPNKHLCIYLFANTSEY
jgi:hypothetical protein